MKILIVEDDRVASQLLCELIEAHHCLAQVAEDGLAGFTMAEQYEYDVIVIDVMLPKLDGISLCRQLRESGYQNSILILTANDQTIDRVTGLDAGADDYLVKPYEPAELMARIRALCRRGKVAATAKITWENLCLDSTSNSVSSGDRAIRLTAKEYCLLELFLYNPQRIFSRSMILDKLWDFTQSPGEQTVCTHIKCVRQKLRAAGVGDPIETVNGFGYRLRVPQESSDTKITIDQPSDRQQVAVKIVQMWEKFKDNFGGQVIVLKEANKLLVEDQLTIEQRDQARHAAHSLAGSLGIFGFMAGSQLAKKIERLWQSTTAISMAEAQLLDTLVAALQQELHQTITVLKQPIVDTYQPASRCHADK
jgi:DNA-binding response OmpR family regulator/HPt (histidine-containing phosphotransfer) domain-containing protein